MNFIDKYNNKKNVRFPFFKKTLEKLLTKEILKLLLKQELLEAKLNFF